MSVLTALTAQDTLGVQAVHDVPTAFVGLQIDCVMRDIGADAVKTGMLSNAAIVELVALKADEFDMRALVVDPVMVAKSGDALLSPDARGAVIELLLPRCLVVTPNLHEARVLTNQPIDSLAGMREAARSIHALGARNVVVKGGHLEASHESIDVLYDGTDYLEYRAERIDTPNTHGTGCTFASAIAAYLAHGRSVPDAVAGAKRFLTDAMLAAAGARLGHGHGPVQHFSPPA
jgi:hydroxymethylpyrimidine/phosphomethylpyrimidine kinase